MNRTELKEILATYGITPKKERGQNFLVDGNLLRAMLDSLDLKPGERVLEVGPGCGVMTREMLAAGCQVNAVEVDPKLYEFLTGTIKDENFRIKYQDAVKVDYDEYLGLPDEFRCIANLPYSISSIFIVRMLELECPPIDMFYLLQREMGERLDAKINTKKYGALTVRTQLMYESKILRVIPPNVFYPPPIIDSVWIRLVLRKDRPDVKTFKAVSELCKLAFSQRRKKAVKMLSSRYGKKEVPAAFEQLGISLDARAENISTSEFLELTKILAL